MNDADGNLYALNNYMAAVEAVEREQEVFLAQVDERLLEAQNIINDIRNEAVKCDMEDYAEELLGDLR